MKDQNHRHWTEVSFDENIPSSWLTEKIRRVAKSERGAFVDGDWIESPYITDSGIRLIQTGNIGIGEYREQGFRYISQETFEALVCTEVKPGDVLVCRLAEPVGRACLAPDLGQRMITSVDVCILRPCDLWDARYVMYFMSSALYLDTLQAFSRGGTRDRISRSFLGNVRIPKPPLEVQRRISAFLDRETAKADALVEKYERLMELLEEKRVALITQAVTKGVDPDVQMKDSGIAWLGEIPKHWDVMRVGSVCGEIKTGPFGSMLHSNEYTLNGIPVVNPAQIVGERIQPDSRVSITRETADRLQQYQLRVGDIVLGRRGEMGRATVVSEVEDGWLCGTGSMRLRCREDILSHYLALFIRSHVAKSWLQRSSQGSTIDNLNPGIVSRIPLPLPPLDEQGKILKRLVAESVTVGQLQQKLKKAVNLVGERRSALITAAVTGQVDIKTYEARALELA